MAKELIDLNPNPDPIDYDEMYRHMRILYEHPHALIAVDTETTGLAVHDGRDSLIGVCYAALVNGEPLSGYVAFAHIVGVNAPQDLQEQLAWVLLQAGRPLIFQNVQFDLNSLLTVEIDARGQAFYDLPTMVNLIDENMPMKSMEAIAKRFAPHVTKLTDDEWLNNQKKTGWPDTTPERMWDYAVNDAEVTFVCWDELIHHPEWIALDESVWEGKQQAIRVLLAMRRRGVRLDFDVARTMAARGKQRMQEILDEIGYEKLGPKALTEILLEKLELPIVKRSQKTGAPSFDKEAMETYDALLEQQDSNLGKLIFEYRGWQKAVSAGYDAYLKAVSPDGRVRTEYTTHVVRTGRLSSREPNLQQIPKKTDKVWNGQMKSCFIASEGFTMWNIDYSQLELRLMAAFAGIPSLKQVFLEGRDIFIEIGETIGQPRDKVKTMVYATSYGAGVKKLALQLGVTEAAAKAMLNDYYRSYPQLKIMSQKLATQAARNKKIEMWSGRFRHMPYPRESYKAMNSFIQGGGADIVERAMVRLYEELEDENCHIVLQVHDAFAFEIRTGMEDHYLPLACEIMSDVDALIAHRIPQGLGTQFAVDSEPWPIYKEESKAA